MYIVPTLKTFGTIDVFVTGDKDFSVLDILPPEILTVKEYVEKY